ncbi:hypothetical protein EKO04_004929 [Ascochyta lentis]|uniref:Uncharacterized protein n=1 Tax=Ascochyta lentis TaxID=205686 RepID=A0A8H7J5T2_9PLEO|nr:hypothetical protein EKO04_004929 [Ascochyta lentis]
MSLPNPLWMQPPNLGLGRGHVPQNQPDQPHLTWPWDLPIKDSVGFELEEVLQHKQGKGCQVVKYLFRATAQDWKFAKATTALEDLKDMVLLHKTPPYREIDASMFLMATSLQDEAIRALGFWMNIPPTFFMLPDVRLRVVAGANELLFTLQYMNKYAVGHRSPQARPSSSSQQYHRFRSKNGQQPHEWHITQARLIFFTGWNWVDCTPSQHSASDSGSLETRSARWRGLYMFDEADDAMALQLRDLMVANDRPDPGQAEVYQGLGQIIENIILLISSKWTEFLDEADLHLQVLSKQCISEDLLPTKQLQYMRELHELSPLWTRVRRHLTAIKDLIAQVLQHEISYSNPNLEDRTQLYYVKRLQVVDDHISRCNDAAAQTNNLISLIFNIATLQESRAAVEESKAANAFAGSIRRVTMLTFVYLPLTLASSILGMNITQITGEGTHSQLWLYFIVAVALMAATFGGWFVWSKLLSSFERSVRRRISKQALKNKGV